MNFPLLSTLVFLPIIGIIIIALTPRKNENFIKWVSAINTFGLVVLAAILYCNFNPHTSELQFVEKVVWIPKFKINYFVGVDGLSILMVLLTALLSFVAVIASWGIKDLVKEYFICYLILTIGMMGVFVSLNLFPFYIFWELTLVPMYLLIGIWGGPQRKYAAIKFLLFTLVGSLAMLLGIISLYFATSPHSTLNIMELPNFTFGKLYQYIVFLAFFLGFAIKVPMFPFHTWLPDAHVEAPTPISVILAGILLKMGGYGFIRICLPIFPDATKYFALPIAILALISIIYGAYVAMAQTDLKKMVAYSSVNHMGYVMLAIVALTATGMNGAILQMFNHGIITGALFLLVGVLYDRAHTRDINAFGGLGVNMPIYAGIMMFFSLASLGLPGLAGFISEFLCFLGAFPTFKIITILAVFGVLITAIFFLRMLQKIFMGELNPKWAHLPRINKIEILSLAPLIILTVLIGVYPKIALDLMNITIMNLISRLGGIN